MHGHFALRRTFYWYSVADARRELVSQGLLPCRGTVPDCSQRRGLPCIRARLQSYRTSPKKKGSRVHVRTEQSGGSPRIHAREGVL